MWKRPDLRRAVAAAAIACTALASFTAVALAQGNGGGGNGGGGGNPDEVIYFTYFSSGQNLLWFMNPDGSEKTPLSPGISGEPSHGIHNASRWFLELADIPGYTYPNGQQRRELFAVNEAGDTVQLTNDPDLQPSGSLRWQPGDGVLSWNAGRWVAGIKADIGIYSAEVLYDPIGNVLPSDPPTLLVPGTDIESHDWAPSGTSLVYRTSGDSLNVVDDVSNPQDTTRTISTGARRSPAGRSPAWSPDGSKIAFQMSGNVIFTINPDGTGLKDVINPTPTTSRNDATWSPTGSHLMYLWSDNFDFSARDVFTVKANGKSKLNLTADLEGPSRPVAWREGPGAGGSGVCGDGVLDPGETPCTCPQDAGDPLPDEVGFCADGIDNDCDGFVDCADANCGGSNCPFQLCEGGAGWAQEEGGCRDPLTGLVWSLPLTNWNWNFATQYADELVEGDFSDWRLPTKAELETAASHLILDKLTTDRVFSWSSTKKGNKVWSVNLLDGSSRLHTKGSSIGFYCVRQGTQP